MPVCAGALDPLAPALDGLPPEDRERLSVRRIPAGTSGVWLHPGEPVFDALSRAVRERFRTRRRARRAVQRSPRPGTVLLPPRPGLGRRRGSARPTGGARDPSRRARPLPRRALPTAVRSNEDSSASARTRNGTLVEEPVERMLLLRGARGAAPGAIPLASRSLPMRVEAARQAQAISERLAEEHRARARGDERERRRQLTAGSTCEPPSSPADATSSAPGPSPPTTRSTESAAIRPPSPRERTEALCELAEAPPADPPGRRPA